MTSLTILLLGSTCELVPPDRPDMTESAYVVPARQVQTELQLFPTPSVMIKTGISSFIDIQLGVDPFQRMWQLRSKLQLKEALPPFASILVWTGMQTPAEIVEAGIGFPAHLYEGKISITGMLSVSKQFAGYSALFGSVSLSTSLARSLSLFMEVAGEYRWEIASTEFYVNTGIVILPISFLQVDIALYWNIVTGDMVVGFGSAFCFCW